MKLRHMFAVALFVAASPTLAAAQDAGSAAEHLTPAVSNGLLWLAGVGLAGVLVERTKRRRV
jgi:hypothetical protein